jgi:hypothetical protein
MLVEVTVSAYRELNTESNDIRPQVSHVKHVTMAQIGELRSSSDLGGR